PARHGAGALHGGEQVQEPAPGRPARDARHLHRGQRRRPLRRPRQRGQEGPPGGHDGNLRPEGHPRLRPGAGAAGPDGPRHGGAGKIALTTGGGTRPDQDFTVTAYVKDPQDGQVVKLILPDGFSFAKGHDAEKTVEKGKGGLAQVSWRVHSARKAGEYVLEAT